MSLLPAAKEVAAALFGTLIEEIADYIDGKVETKPASLLVLPDTLQSRVELERAKRRPAPGGAAG